MRRAGLPLLGLILLLSACGGPAPLRLLNASYDPTRELYRDLNAAYAAAFKARDGRDLRIQMSHGGSGKQARAILDGLPADVASLALPWDVDVLAAAGLVDRGWRGAHPRDSEPFSSTIVFLVREGNPKGIRDWGDLTAPGVSVVTANPKVSGGARCVYLAAWAWGLRGGEAAAEDYVRRLYAHVPILDAGSRAATTTFVDRRQGDVLLTWENEAWLARQEAGGRGVQVVTPSQSLRCGLPVAVVSGVAGPDGRARLAADYVAWLWSPEAQAIAAAHHFRPADPAAAAKAGFPALKLLDVAAVAGSWEAAQKRHFAAGALFDRLLEARR